MSLEKDYKILVVERDSSAREQIASTLAKADLKSSIAEEKSVARAITHLLNADLNVLVVGPSLDIEEVKKLQSCPSNFGKRVIICLDPDIAEQIKCNNILRYPFQPQFAKDVIEIAFRLESIESKPVVEESDSRVNEATQLAFVIGRLVDRLDRVSDALKKQPKETRLYEKSIPEAVNFVISEASKIRQGHEQDDIKSLIGQLFK